MKVYNLGSATKPLTIDHRVYSPDQLTIANNLMNWIQRSSCRWSGSAMFYSGPRQDVPYNQDTRSLPPAYGAYAKIYTDLKPGAGGKIEPATNSHYWWSIWVNAVCGEPAIELSTPEQYYFTLPTWNERSSTSAAELEKAADLSQHPVLGRFPSYFDGRKFIVLARGNRLPFVKLTKGEYLDALEAAIVYQYRARTDPNHASEAGRRGWDRPGHGVRRTNRKRSVSRHLQPIASDTRAACRKSRRSPTSNRTSSSSTIPTCSWDRAAAPSTFPSTRWTRRWPSSPQRAAAVDHRRVEQRAEPTHEQAAARRHHQQLRLRVPLQLFFRAGEGERPGICAAS